MKSIDFSQPGGFPLTQDQLNHLQSGYKDAVLALARIGGYNAGPFAVSGMEVTNTAPGEYTVTEGWFLYNDDIVHITGGGISGIAAGHRVYVQIESANSSVYYNDGTSKEVILDNYAVLTSLPTGTPEDSTKFLLDNLRRFGTGLGLANKESTWNTLVVNTDPSVGGVTGTVYYKKNFITNTLQIRGMLSANNAQNFAASPGAAYSIMGTFPASYIPLNTAHFTAYYFVAGLIKDDLGVSWIKQVNGGMTSTGQFFLNWLKPESSITAYALSINAILPLD